MNMQLRRLFAVHRIAIERACGGGFVLTVRGVSEWIASRHSALKRARRMVCGN